MRFLNRTLRAVIAVAAVLPIPAAVLAQDAKPPEPAATSRLTGIALPEGAFRLTDARMQGELATQLKTVAAAGGFTLGETETVLWGGPGHTGARSKEIKDALIQTLGKAGYNYQNAGETDIKEGRLTLFLAGNTGAKQATLGIFVAGNSSLALTWGAVTPKNGAKEAKPAAKGAVPADLLGNWMWTTISGINYRDTTTNQLLEPSGMAVRMSFTKAGRYTFFFYVRQRTYSLVTAATTTHEGAVIFSDDGTFTLHPEKGHYKGSTTGSSRIVDRPMTEAERKPVVYHWEWRTADGKRQLYMGPSSTSMSLFKPAE